MSEAPWYLEKPHRVSDLGLDPLQQARVLEWYANRILVASEEATGEPDYCGKSYDPLTIELDTRGGGTAHSYIFDFRDGGRHHPFHSLNELETWLQEEAIDACRDRGEVE